MTALPFIYSFVPQVKQSRRPAHVSRPLPHCRVRAMSRDGYQAGRPPLHLSEPQCLICPVGLIIPPYGGGINHKLSCEGLFRCQ